MGMEIAMESNGWRVVADIAARGLHYGFKNPDSGMELPSPTATDD
jgi:hypothetical protein